MSQSNMSHVYLFQEGWYQNTSQQKTCRKLVQNDSNSKPTQNVFFETKQKTTLKLLSERNSTKLPNAIQFSSFS
jgi:hypothetical protein